MGCGPSVAWAGRGAAPASGASMESESVPAWMARQMSTLLVPVRSAASCRLNTVIARCPIGFVGEGFAPHS